MQNGQRMTLEMRSLLLCADVQFLGTTRGVMNQFRVTPKIVSNCDAALEMIQAQGFDVIVLDWREIDSLGDFLCSVRRSKANQDCILVAIVRDMLDLHQAFAAGVHFLIHKPASQVQIERCLRAAYCARVARRRKQHRELVSIEGSLSTRTHPAAKVMVVNLSEGGVGVRMVSNNDIGPSFLSVADQVDLSFPLPGTSDVLHSTGTVVWTIPGSAGIRFSYIPDPERLALEHWLTACVERSLAEMCERLRAVCA